MAPSASFLFFSMFFFTTPVRSEELCTTGECSTGHSAGLSLIQSPAARARALHKVQAHDSDAEDVDSQRKEESQEGEAELEEDRDEAMPIEGHKEAARDYHDEYDPLEEHAAEHDEHEYDDSEEDDGEDDDHLASLAEEDEHEEDEHEEDEHEEHDEDKQDGEHDDEHGEQHEHEDDYHLASLAEESGEEHDEHDEHDQNEEHEDEHDGRRQRRHRRTRMAVDENEHGKCNPCKIRGEEPKGSLMLDIFTPAADQASPVVIAFHGCCGATLTKMHSVCQEVAVPAGFVCVAVDPLGAKSLEGAIRFMTEHADTYGVDPDNFFAYGYSQGGHSPLAFTMLESDVGNKLKGIVSDSSAFKNAANFVKKDSNGNYLRMPAYLMIHCDVDPVVKPKDTVKASEKRLKKANKKRGKHDQIQWQSMRFSKATGCAHHQLVIHSDVGGKAMVSFIRSVSAGADPFKNKNIPKTVTDKNVAKKK